MRKLKLPPDSERVRELAAGEELLLYGEVLTMRDAALGRLEALDSRGEAPPFTLAGHVVFHAGPTPAPEGSSRGVIGPTTSARMDRFLPLLFRMGVRATLGKGPRSSEAAAEHASSGAVYLAAVGGVAALYADMVEKIEVVAWEDLGPEAVHRVVLEGFPALVAIDASGEDYLRSQHNVFRCRDK